MNKNQVSSPCNILEEVTEWICVCDKKEEYYEDFILFFI